MLLLASSVCGLFKWRQFEPEVILLAVGWYLRFSLSYRDVEELLAERGLHADHVTVWRWVQRYAPEMERRLRSRDTRKPAFSLVLGSLAHDRRLRSDPYDPQRPGVRKRASGEGRSTPLLHSWFVQRGDGLILRTLSPNVALTPKLQHYPPRSKR